MHVVASILEFVSNPLVGAVSDDRGRKNFLLVSLLATAVSLLAIGIAPSKFTIAVSGALRGLTAVSITMGNAMIVDMSKLGKPGGDARPRMAGGQRGDQQAAAVQVRDRGSSGSTRSGTDDTAGVTVAPDAGDDATQRQDVTVNLGLLLAAAALGLMCGPIIGGVLSLVSLRAPFVLAAVVEVVNMVFVRGLVPETLQRRTYFTWSAANPLRLGHMLFKTPVLRSGTLILILVNVGLAVYSQVRCMVARRGVGAPSTACTTLVVSHRQLLCCVLRVRHPPLLTRNNPSYVHPAGRSVDPAAVRLEGAGPWLLLDFHRPARRHDHRRREQGHGAQVGRLPRPHRRPGLRRGADAAAGLLHAQLDVVPCPLVHLAHLRGADCSPRHHHEASAPSHAGQDPG